MDITNELMNLRFELDDAKTILGMMVPSFDSAEEKAAYLIGRRDSVAYLLEAIMDGMDNMIGDLEGEPEPEKTMWDKLKEVQNVNAL